MHTKKGLPLSDEDLIEFEAGRDLFSELMEGAADIRAGRGKVVYSPVIAARKNTGLSEADFASLLGVSLRTLRAWEQGRKQPSGAAITVLAIAREHPKILLAIHSKSPEPHTSSNVSQT
ncbi:helix-turn-helix domain-containing protein [Oxalobacteraceae bacterium A2-2]